jgi:hypothetical protein
MTFYGLFKKQFFVRILKATTKTAGSGSAYRSGSESGSISQRLGSADPDPHQNVMDPEHCPLPPSPISELDRRHTGRMRKEDNLLTGEGGRGVGGAKSYDDGEKAWSSKSHSILSGISVRLYGKNLRVSR